MQFIPEGPNIPEALLNAHADGKVVFFCGAGVSVDAGYPLFDGLVRQLRDLNPVTKTQELEDVLARMDYDFALSILQNIIGKGNPKLRHDTAQILSRRPSTLQNHRTILKLSRQRDETCRLVTTNFDRLFIKAAKGIEKVNFDTAPKLPVPRPDRWNSVVHLHGVLPLINNNWELTNLIITSADFGEAYVTESYCSRFIVELLRHFTLVFVGYSMDDRVMRYLLDAISFSERHLREDNQATLFHKPYTFVEHNEHDEAEVIQRWAQKEVVPIPYFVEETERKKRGSHRRLYETLDAWSELAAGGQRARVTLALNEAQKPFLPEDTFTQERLLWALKDDSGRAAEALANTQTAAETASIKWLDFFAANGLFDQVYSPVEWQMKVVERSGFKERKSNNELRYQGSITNGFREPQVKPVTEHLLNWMQWHLDKIELVDWFLKNGGVPHSAFQWIYNNPRNEKKQKILIDTDQRKLWDIITSDIYRKSRMPLGYWFDLRANLDLTDLLCSTEFLTHINPKLEIIPSALRNFEGSSKKFLDQFEYNLKFVNHQMDYQVKQMIAKADHYPGIEALCSPLSQSIARGLNWLFMVGEITSEIDLTGYSIPSISVHDQNSYVDEFGQLIFLLRVAFDKLMLLDSNAAQEIAQIWKGVNYPLFKRLFLYAACKLGTPLDKSACELLTGNDGQWLWALDTNRETKLYLRERVSGWTPQDVDRLCAVILEGPPRNRFRELTDGEWMDVRDRNVSRQLKKLEQGGVQLPNEARDKLIEFDRRYPFVLPDDHSDEFVVYTSGVRSVSWDENIVPSAFINFSERTAIDRVVAWEASKDADHLRKLALEKPIQAVETLEEGLNRNLIDSSFWREGFYGLSGVIVQIANTKIEGGEQNNENLETSKAPTSDLLDRVLAILRKLPERILVSTEVINAIIEFWRSAPVKLLPRVEYLDIWDRLWSAAASHPAADRDAKEAVSYAINDPAGRLTEDLISYLWPKEARVGAGLPIELTARLARIVNRTDHQHFDASSIIVASRLDILRAVAPDFADESVVPLLNWRLTPSAPAYWNAFLWFARISPDLYKKIEIDFLVAIEHPERLDEHGYKTLCQLFLLASMELRAVAPDVTSRTIGNLSKDALRSLSSFIRHRMLNAKGGSANYWDSTVRPWLLAYWPRDHSKRSEGIVEDFAMTALYCGEHFPKAMNWFEENGLLGRTPTATTMLLSLRSENERTHEDFKDSSSFPERFPSEVLHLLWIARPFQWDNGYGRGILERVAQAQPALRGSPKFHDLTELLA